MKSKQTAWLFIAFALLTGLACNAFAGSPEPGLPPPPTAPVDIPTPLGGAGETPGPTEIAPTVTLTGTAAAPATPAADEPQVIVLVDLNVRSGPGVQYQRVGFLLKGESALVVGAEPDSGWWKIACPARADEGVTECWVSGGSQYTRAENTAGVPVAAAPATSTPVPAELDPDSGILAYIDGGRVNVMLLDLTQNPPTPAENYLLSEADDVLRIQISNDGRRLAYIAGAFNINRLGVVDLDGSDERVLVRSEELDPDGEAAADGLAVFIDQVQWLPDSQGLAFNSGIVSLEGPGVGSRQDLWTVTLDGEASQRYAPDSGGGAFAVGPNDLVIMSQGAQVLRGTVAGNSETLINFESINTASEYTYFPQPQWVSGNQAYLAIPSAEPFAEDAGAGLWRLPAQGPAVALGEVPGLILFNPIVWTDDGRRLAYVERIAGAGDTPDKLVVADANGLQPATYHEAESLTFLGWSEDGQELLFGSPTFIAVGHPGEGPVIIPVEAGVAIGGGQWLDANSFVVVVGTVSTWTFSSGSRDGLAPLVTVIGDGPAAFDVWAP